MLDEYAEEIADTSWKTDSVPGAGGGGLEVMVGPGTCKLYYASGSEEAGWRVREVGGQKSNDTSGGTGPGEEAESNANVVNVASTGRRRERNRRRRRGSPEEEQEDREQEEELGEWERLKERAEARMRERKRWIAQFDQGLLF